MVRIEIQFSCAVVDGVQGVRLVIHRMISHPLAPEIIISALQAPRNRLRPILHFRILKRLPLCNPPGTSARIPITNAKRKMPAYLDQTGCSHAHRTAQFPARYRCGNHGAGHPRCKAGSELKFGGSENIRGVNCVGAARWVSGFDASACGIPIRSSLLAVNLSAASRACGQRIDGLLGADFLEGRVAQIDYQAGKIRVLDHAVALPAASHCRCVAENSTAPSASRFRSHGNNPPEWVRLDTGCDEALHWVAGKRDRLQTSPTVLIGLSQGARRIAKADVRLGARRIPISNVAIGVRESGDLPRRIRPARQRPAFQIPHHHRHPKAHRVVVGDGTNPGAGTSGRFTPSLIITICPSLGWGMPPFFSRLIAKVSVGEIFCLGLNVALAFPFSSTLNTPTSTGCGYRSSTPQSW